MATRQARIAFAALAAALLAPSPAHAGARTVTMLGVSGSGGAEIGAQLEQGLAELYELVDGAIYKTAAEQMGRKSAAPEDVAEVAHSQKIDAIVAGSTQDGERLRVIVRDGASGEVIARNVYPLTRARLTDKVREAVVRDLVEALDRAEGVPRPQRRRPAPVVRPSDDVTIERAPRNPSSDDETPPARPPRRPPPKVEPDDDDEPKRARPDSDDETPPLPKRAPRNGDDETPPLPKRAPRDSDDETPPLPKRAPRDSDDETPPLPKRAPRDNDDETPSPKRAPRDSDDETPSRKRARDDDDAPVVRKKRPVTPPGVGLEAGVGIGLMTRDLEINAPGATPYRGSAVGAVRFDAAIFPFAWSRAIRFSHPALATFGVAVSWIEALPFSSLNAAGTSTTPGHARRYQLALVSRIPFGSAARPSLAISTGVGSIDYRSDDPTLLGVPDVGYHHFNFGIALEVPFGTPRVSLGAAASLLALFDAGAIGSATEYGAGTGYGADGAVTFTVRPTRWLWLRAAIRYTTMSLTFDGSGAHAGSGARDSFFDGALEVGYSG